MNEHERLGWNAHFERQRLELNDPELSIARVAAEHRGQYVLLSPAGESRAALGGRLRHQTESRLDLPAVGDWVGVREGVIEHVFARTGAFVRGAAGRRTEAQVVAANIDLAFVITAADGDFNPRRLERYAAAAWDAGAEPVIVINKADVGADAEQLAAEVVWCSVLITSALHGTGLDQMRQHLRPGATAVLVGSSGVGKSTLLNALLGAERQVTGEVRERDRRGQHTTTHRELIAIPETGALLVDTPGMRELSLWSGGDGVSSAFAEIERLAESCRFRDCEHQSEPGCAVRDAVEPERLASYFKLLREQAGTEARREALGRHELRKHAKRRAAEIKVRTRLRGR